MLSLLLQPLRLTPLSTSHQIHHPPKHNQTELHQIHKPPDPPIPPPQHRPPPPRKRRIHKPKRQPRPQMLHRNLQPTTPPILMKPILRPRPTITHPPRILNARQQFLAADRGGVVEGVVVGPGSLGEGGGGGV